MTTSKIYALSVKDELLGETCFFLSESGARWALRQKRVEAVKRGVNVITDSMNEFRFWDALTDEELCWQVIELEIGH